MLYLISTPIGNLDDLSIRAIRTMFSVDILLCEDTRRTGQLLSTIRERFPSLIGVNDQTPKLISYYNEVEVKRLPEVISWLEAGKTLGLVSDNGTPLISDPGFTLIRECRKRQLQVTAVPGPSAVITALTLSGYSVENFRFVGFLPDKQTAQKKVFANLSSGPNQTIVAYVSPHRLLQTLESMEMVYGHDHHLVIARELTKIHETVWEGSIEEAMVHFIDPKGEFVLIWMN
jgi:16S rRNA (cytidine1402-2'-O)-methyltransferase